MEKCGSRSPSPAGRTDQTHTHTHPYQNQALPGSLLVVRHWTKHIELDRRVTTPCLAGGALASVLLHHLRHRQRRPIPGPFSWGHRSRQGTRIATSDPACARHSAPSTTPWSPRLQHKFTRTFVPRQLTCAARARHPGGGAHACRDLAGHHLLKSEISPLGSASILSCSRNDIASKSRQLQQLHPDLHINFLRFLQRWRAQAGVFQALGV